MRPRHDRVLLSSLKPAPYNPRQPLDDRTRSELMASLGRWGCLQPIIVNKKTGHIVGGHQRVEVLRDLGHKEVDVIVVSLNLEEEKALNIALNKIQGQWDETKLAQVLDELVEVPDFNVELTGFSAEEVADLAAEHLRPPVEEREESPGGLPEPAADAEAVTRSGDLIELGRHRLLCGDSTKPEEVRRVMGGRRAALMASDPPYFVDYDAPGQPATPANAATAATAASIGLNKRWDHYQDAASSVTFYADFIAAALGHALTEAPAIYQWYASKRYALVALAWERCGLLLHQQLIWVKEQPVLSRSDFMWMHEPAAYGWIEGKPPSKRPPSNETTVWHVSRKHNRDGIHPTQKPLELFERPIRWHTNPGDVVFEPFCGSGTQIIAAERLGRVCCSIEQSPGFCDSVVRRYLSFVGHGGVTREVAQKYRVKEPAR
jgi:DNA modification methylase